MEREGEVVGWMYRVHNNNIKHTFQARMTFAYKPTSNFPFSHFKSHNAILTQKLQFAKDQATQIEKQLRQRIELLERDPRRRK